MVVNKINPFQRIIPMIYAYNTPEIASHNGWTKIGYTDKQTVEDRIKQQTHTANVQWHLAWKNNAMYADGSGEYFTDHDFHKYLVNSKHIERMSGTEWFHIDGSTSKAYFYEFAERIPEEAKNQCTYTLRDEQEEAVRMTANWFKYENGKKFLWNAKPRFGKTLSSYDLIQRLKYKNVLIVTNRPSIANSWLEDFNKFVGWKNEYAFVSETDALTGKPGVYTYNGYTKSLPKYGEEGHHKNMIAFESLQGLKGSVYFGGNYNKLKWIHDTVFDLLIVDESQEGVNTFKTEQAFKYLKTDHVLYLSGTPFKQLASDEFRDSEIFNWSYADEQEKKNEWDKKSESFNPYESLPRLNMYTYELSHMIYDKLHHGADITETYTTDFAFDLNEFFSVKSNGRFKYEDEVKRFLKSLYTQEKYPYSTQELRESLAHTLWLLNRIDSANALKRLLQEDEVFKDYHIVMAVGNGSFDDDKENKKAFDRVKNAIQQYDKTITLSVGQLTVGVTIPEWSGIMMLCNLKSASSYMQAAFRVQNPCKIQKNGQTYQKENAYIFDFDPSRTLIIFDEFANNLSKRMASGNGTTEEREKNIRTLLNFFPVLGEDTEGRMVELDPKQVLSIPRKLKSQEVVRHGFMSNFLFQNIANIFSAPSKVQTILQKLNPAHEDKKKKKDSLDDIKDVSVDENGNVEVSNEIVIGKTQDLFGPKIYEDIEEVVQSDLEDLRNTENHTQEKINQSVENIHESVKNIIKEKVLEPAKQNYDVKKSVSNKIEKDLMTNINKQFETSKASFDHDQQMAKIKHDVAIESASSQEEIEQAHNDYKLDLENAMNNFSESITSLVDENVKETPQKVIEKYETEVEEEKKNSVESKIRDHLRGFSRTIPSFIMAYGDENLTLQNFDDYTDDDVFEEVTGITEDQFRFLRDGGYTTDPDTGETQYFKGHLFDEVVFNDSIKEFLRKKNELNNYFDESLTEDIFDYIPPQKTNQIYTPKKVVKKMVDLLEEENPGCFDDPNATFADLYMKSGMYITEIVKRLYKSPKMKELYPDSQDRLVHIFEKQVYGCAPTKIIYLIARNYILGFDEDRNIKKHHLIQFDTLPAAQNGTLEQELERRFDL